MFLRPQAGMPSTWAPRLLGVDLIVPPSSGLTPVEGKTAQGLLGQAAGPALDPVPLWLKVGS